MFNTQLNWKDPAITESAISLQQTQEIVLEPGNEALVKALLESNWLVKSSKDKNIFQLSARGAEGILQLLELRIPNWRALLPYISGSRGQQRRRFLKRWEFLSDRLRSDFPYTMNKDLAKDIFAADPELLQERGFQDQLPRVSFNKDRFLHLRGNNLDLKFLYDKGDHLDITSILRQTHEMILPERDIQRIEDIDGNLPFLLLTVEDRGLFMDLETPEQVLLIWTPPDVHIDLVADFLQIFPQFVPHIHFGNLDHRGLILAERIAQESFRPVKRFIPEFWSEYLFLYARRVKEGREEGAAWKGGSLSVELIKYLMDKELWIKQNVLLLDARLYEEIKKLI